MEVWWRKLSWQFWGTIWTYVGNEVLTVVTTKSMIFWVVLLYRSLEVHWHFRGAYLLHLQIKRVSQARKRHQSEQTLCLIWARKEIWSCYATIGCLIIPSWPKWGLVLYALFAVLAALSCWFLAWLALQTWGWSQYVSSETLADFYQTSQHYIPEDHTILSSEHLSGGTGDNHWNRLAGLWARNQPQDLSNMKQKCQSLNLNIHFHATTIL